MIRCEAEMCRNWTGQGCACEFLGMEPDYVQTLSSGAQPTDEPLTLHPVIAEDLDRQMSAMEQARAQASVSCHDYLLAARALGLDHPAGRGEGERT